MATTLTITVDYDSTLTRFSYALSYTDASGTAWAGSCPDGGTVAFVNSGHYTLTDGAGTPNTFVFDQVSVVLGSSLNSMSSQKCDCRGKFDLGSIGFPTIPAGESKVSTPYSWCQQYSGGSGPVLPHFKDPKLGLSNTTGNSPAPALTFPVPCVCNCT